jgi:hypothetical protein
MVKIGLVERLALALVDGARVAVPDGVELPGLGIVAHGEFDHARLVPALAVKLDRDVRADDLPYRARLAVGEAQISGALRLGVAGKLDAVALGEHLRAVPRLENMVFAQRAALAPQGPYIMIERVHVRVGEGKDKALAVRLARAVARIARRKNLTVDELCSDLAEITAEDSDLAATIRLYVLGDIICENEAAVDLLPPEIREMIRKPPTIQ